MMPRQASAREAARAVRASPTLNLASIDLNLLVSLEVLLDQCNVTHAAYRVGLSQPAMSRALSRLRGMFNDDLLVRTSAGLVRTTRGEELHARLPTTLGAIRELVASRAGVAQAWRSTLRIAMPDHQAFILLPHLMQRLASRSVPTEMVTEPLQPNALKRLEAGEIEFVIGQAGGATSGFYQRTLYSDRYACLLRRGHPALMSEWTADSFYAQRHAVIAAGPDGEFGRVFDSLGKILPDRSRMITPNTMGTPMLVAETDLVLTVPYRVAVKMAAMLPLVVADLPVEAPPYEVTLLWHERSHRNTEHAWMRAEIAAAAQAHGATPPVAAPVALEAMG